MSKREKIERRRLGVGWKLCLTAVLLAAVFFLNRDQFRTVFERRVDFRPFAIGFLFYFAGLLLSFTRWYLLVRALGLPFRLRDAVRLGLIGNVFNLLIPGAVGGDVVKAAYLCREQERKAQAVASMIIDRIVGLLGLLLLAGVAGVLTWGSLPRPGRVMVCAVLACLTILVGLLGLIFSSALFHFLGRRPDLSPRRKKRLEELAIMGAAYRRRPAVVLLGVGLAVVTHIGNVLAFYSASRALFDVLPGLGEHFVAVPLILFSTAVPLPLGALGLSEEVSAQLFRMASNDKRGAVAMMAFRVLQYTGAMLSACVFLAERRGGVLRDQAAPESSGP